MTKEKDMQWIPVYYNNNYLVNIYSAEVKNKETGKILKETDDRNRILIALYKNGKLKKYYLAKIVLSSYYNRNIEGYIKFKDNNYRNCNIYNLNIVNKKYFTRKYKVIQYKNNLLDKIYNSIKEFSNETGIERRTIKRRNGVYKLGIYKFEIPEYQKGDYIYEN